MDDHDGCGEIEYGMVAVKRDWIPEWLFAMFKWLIPYQPFRFIFTRKCQ